MNMAGLLSKKEGGGAPQSVKHPTLDLSSGLDLRVRSSSPSLRCMLNVEPTKTRKEGVGR